MIAADMGVDLTACLARLSEAPEDAKTAEKKKRAEKLKRLQMGR